MPTLAAPPTIGATVTNPVAGVPITAHGTFVTGHGAGGNADDQNPPGAGRL